MLDMAVRPKEPEPVSEFVRELMAEWEASGKRLKDLAKLAGLGTSMPSQIKNGSSDVTNYSGPKLAKAFGMGYPELVSLAYERQAAKKRGEAPPLGTQHPDRSLAIEMAKALNASDEAIRRVLESHNGPGFEGLDAASWMIMFLQEAQNEHRTRLVARAEEHDARAVAKKRKRYHDGMERERAAGVAAKKQARAPSKQSA